MIAQLTGKVARVGGGFVVLDVHGVGYRVNVPVSVLETVSTTNDAHAPVTLVTHTLVREDDISLYGFSEEVDLRVFELLLTVSGIGPKAALALLSALSASALAQAVSGEDVKTLTRVPGIGLKTAQRMVLELKERFTSLGFERKLDALFAEKTKPKDVTVEMQNDVVSMLENLGYNKNEAKKAAESAIAERAGGELPPVHVLLRAALNKLTGAGR